MRCTSAINLQELLRTCATQIPDQDASCENAAHAEAGELRGPKRGVDRVAHCDRELPHHAFDRRVRQAYYDQTLGGIDEPAVAPDAAPHPCPGTLRCLRRSRVDQDST